MKITVKIVALILVILIAVPACEEELNTEERIANEERYFALYMDANYPDLTASSSGLYFTSIEEGTGASPDSGDVVLINYVAFTIPDERIVDTYDETWARDANLYVEGIMYGPYKFEVGKEIDGLDEGVSMMKEGGIARLIFKSDLGYGVEGFTNTIKPYTSLIYDVQLVEVIGDPAPYEQQMIAAYLDSIDSYTTLYDEETDATYYYIEDQPGSGDLIEEDDEITLYYQGSLLDGRVFDENSVSDGGFDVTLGTTSLIRGWTIGLEQFRYGGKGRLLLPYALAYGETGELASGTRKYSIPPYEPLLFEIIVLDESTEK
jgi:FKBP-type peptidyl-prolyl cis-trans isomerase